MYVSSTGQEAETGGSQALLEFLWKRQGKANSLGLTRLNNCSRVVSTCLVSRLKMIKAGEYYLLKFTG